MGEIWGTSRVPTLNLPVPSFPPRWARLPLPGAGWQAEASPDSVACRPRPDDPCGLRPTLFFPPRPPPHPRVSSLRARDLLPHLVWGGAASSSSSPALSPLLCLRGLFSLAGQGPLLSPCLVLWALVSLSAGGRGQDRCLRGYLSLAPLSFCGLYTRSEFSRV